MARATYIFLVILEDGTVVPYTVKWEMVQDIAHGRMPQPVLKVIRAKDSSPDYAQSELDESEWRPE
jgi:hypothetical protein